MSVPRSGTLSYKEAAYAAVITLQDRTMLNLEGCDSLNAYLKDREGMRRMEKTIKCAY